jgi:PKD repeat protein
MAKSGWLSLVLALAFVLVWWGNCAFEASADGDDNGDAVCDMGAYEYGAISSTLQAAFSGAPLSGRPPLAVTFTNQSSGTYTATLWHFGDGETSTSENPTHTYTVTGAFTVTLTISGATSIDTETKPGYVKVWEATSHVHLPLILKRWITSEPPSQVAGCDVFPADNVWNTPIDALPVDANSAAYVATIGTSAYVHADFGSGEWPPGSGSPIGIPYVDVPSTQPGVIVTFEYDDESDPSPYPIPPDAPIEGGPDSDGDRHVLVVDRDDCVLYELFYARPQTDGSWTAGSGAVFDLDSHALRPDGWTSADAAGLPILPGLVRYEEVASGEIRHALRFTAPQTRRAYVWPARHYASSHTGLQYPPMGQRFRLRANFDISGFSPEVQVILQALKTYGMMLADNGSAWYISGAPDERWDNDALHELHQVHGSDFEAVNVSSLMVDPNSGQVQTSR